MINLIPDEAKKEIRFSRLNASLLKYMGLSIGVAIFMSAVMFGGIYHAENQHNKLEGQVSSKRQSIQALLATQKEAQTIESQLDKIESLYEQQSYYSSFLDELGEYMPSWGQIVSINMKRVDDTTGYTGSSESDNPKRLIMQLEVNNQAQVPQLREILLEMPRVEFVDIQNYSVSEANEENGTPGGISATFVLALTQPPHIPLDQEEN